MYNIQFLDAHYFGSDLGCMAQASQNWKLMTENETLLHHVNTIEVEGKNIEADHNITRGIKFCDK